MYFHDLYTVWVIRDEKPYFVGVAASQNEAVEFGNKTVSTRQFVIKQYSCSEQELVQTQQVETSADPELALLSKLQEQEQNTLNLENILINDD